MKRVLALAALVLLSAAPAVAQRATTPDSVVKKLTGNWEGNYYSPDGGESTMKVVVARDSAWHGTMDIKAPHPVPTMQLDDFKVTGNALSWSQKVMDGSCTTKATLIGADLKGELTCPFGTMGFLLHKK